MTDRGRLHPTQRAYESLSYTSDAEEWKGRYDSLFKEKQEVEEELGVLHQKCRQYEIEIEDLKEKNGKLKCRVHELETGS